VAEYLEGIREGFDDDMASQRARILIGQLAEADVVVLDDLGGENLTAWAREQLLLLVNRLYNRRVALIVTTNFDGDDLADHFDGRVISRIQSLTSPLQMPGEDRRLARKELERPAK
jgi:primosomal protein DnaI